MRSCRVLARAVRHLLATGANDSGTPASASRVGRSLDQHGGGDGAAAAQTVELCLEVGHHVLLGRTGLRDLVQPGWCPAPSRRVSADARRLKLKLATEAPAGKRSDGPRRAPRLLAGVPPPRARRERSRSAGSLLLLARASMAVGLLGVRVVPGFAHRPRRRLSSSSVLIRAAVDGEGRRPGPTTQAGAVSGRLAHTSSHPPPVMWRRRAWTTVSTKRWRSIPPGTSYGNDVNRDGSSRRWPAPGRS
jgi:hypothetical protein